MEPLTRQQQLNINGYTIDFDKGGEGPPLLLLHGFPETKLGWQKISPSLIDRFTVIIPDLPGYGASTGPKPGDKDQQYSKRAVGNILLEFMQQLGYKQFAMAGHDRGARVAYRMALDHSAVITQLALLNIIPTLEMMERMDYDKAIKMENWLFLSQPAPFAETMINSNPGYYLNYVLDSWSGKPELIDASTREVYLHYFSKPEVIATICSEYRANEIDRTNDRDDRDATRRIHCPTLLLWSDLDFPVYSERDAPSITLSPLEIWENWAYQVSGKGLPCGHFLMEELPEKVIEEFLQFFKA
jgi:haloacetate dehalogenase